MLSARRLRMERMLAANAVMYGLQRVDERRVAVVASGTPFLWLQALDLVFEEDVVQAPCWPDSCDIRPSFVDLECWA